MFTIYLPAVSDPAKSSFQLDSCPVNPGGNEVVLVVDDEEQLRKILCTTLRSKGYCVLEADSANSAMQIIENRTGPIDLLVTDIVMPGMSGPDLARSLRQSGQVPRAILISGYADDFLNSDLNDVPATIVLQKPIPAEGLLRSVRMLLDRKLATP